MRQCYVYILASRSRRLYIGVTNDLLRRVWQHQSGTIRGFARRYQMNRLVYFESTPSIRAAIVREKQLKGWRRERKLALVLAVNPEFKDLSAGWFGVAPRDSSPLSGSE